MSQYRPICSLLFLPESMDGVGKLDGLLVFVRDVLGEVASAASASDIRLILYGGDIPSCYTCQENLVSLAWEKENETTVLG